MQIDVNQLANSLNAKIDLPQGLNQSQIDYVIDWKAPTTDDPTWYRVYKSGWVEQGGYTTTVNQGSINITLPITMANINYTCTATYKSPTAASGGYSNACGATIVSESVITVFGQAVSTGTYFWQVSGMGEY